MCTGSQLIKVSQYYYYLFNKYLPSAFCVPGTVLGAWATAVNNTDRKIERQTKIEEKRERERDRKKEKREKEKREEGREKERLLSFCLK